MKSRLHGFLAVFRLSLVEGNDVGNAGEGVVFEAEAQDLIQRLSRFEGLGVDGYHPRVLGAKLVVQVDAHGDALDLADAGGQAL